MEDDFILNNWVAEMQQACTELTKEQKLKISRMVNLVLLSNNLELRTCAARGFSKIVRRWRRERMWMNG